MGAMPQVRPVVHLVGQALQPDARTNASADLAKARRVHATMDKTILRTARKFTRRRSVARNGSRTASMLQTCRHISASTTNASTNATTAFAYSTRRSGPDPGRNESSLSFVMTATVLNHIYRGCSVNHVSYLWMLNCCHSCTSNL